MSVRDLSERSERLLSGRSSQTGALRQLAQGLMVRTNLSETRNWLEICPCFLINNPICFCGPLDRDRRCLCASEWTGAVCGEGNATRADKWSEMSTQARFDLRRRRLVQPSSFNLRLVKLLRPFPSASRTDVCAPLSQPKRGCSSTLGPRPAGPSFSNIR